MLDLHNISGKRFTVLLTTPAEGEDDWALFPGVARLEGDTLFVDRAPRRSLEVRPEWIDRIKPVDPPLRGILRGADYYLPLTVGHLDEVVADLAPSRRL